MFTIDSENRATSMNSQHVINCLECLLVCSYFQIQIDFSAHHSFCKIWIGRSWFNLKTPWCFLFLWRYIKTSIILNSIYWITSSHQNWIILIIHWKLMKTETARIQFKICINTQVWYSNLRIVTLTNCKKSY